MSRNGAERDEEMRELVRAGMTERTSAAHDAAVLSAARAFADEPPSVSEPTRRVRNWAVVWAAAASLAAIAIGLVLAWQVIEHRRVLTAASADREQLTTRVAQLQEQVAELERRSASLADALERAQRVAVDVAGAAASGVERLLATIALAPGAVRGEDETPLVRAATGEGMIRLQLDLGPVAAHDAYRVAIATTAGKQVWSSGPLRPLGAGGRKTLTVDAPAGLLASGAYELTLRAEGSSDDLTYYYFDVARR